jgi:hypothetical protein
MSKRTFDSIMVSINEALEYTKGDNTKAHSLTREDWARQQEREKWLAEREKLQGILAEKDAEIARLREQLENRL